MQLLKNNRVAGQITVECLDVGQAGDILHEMEPLLTSAYHSSHMYHDLAEDIARSPDPFRLFLARLDEDDVGAMPIGSAVVERKTHSTFNYEGLLPVHVKRFTVLEAFRGMGIGKRLLDECKSYAFEQAGLSALFVESNEIGALSMYGREGALYSRAAIAEYYRRNSPDQALRFFSQAINDPSRRAERYPNGEGIRFVFAKDEQMTERLLEMGYVSKVALSQLSDLS